MTDGLNLAHTERVPAISWISTGLKLDPRNHDGAGKAVFVFPDRGRRCRQTAVEMMQSATTFGDTMRLCHKAFEDLADWSLLDTVQGSDTSPSPDRIEVAQTVLFAITVSMAKQWQALGMQPDAVLGNGLGEIAAAYIAGALSLPDAAKVVALRSRAVSAIDPVEGISRAAQVETWTEALREQLSGVHARTADVAFISTVTGAALNTCILDGDYWSANLGQPAQLGHAVRWASDHGYRMFIEASPQPELTAEILKSLGDRTVAE